MLISIFSVSVIFLEIFSKNLSDTSILPLFDHFFANISGSNEPILLIFELSLTNENRSLLKKDSSKSVQIYSSYRDDRQTDRRTDGQTDRRTDGQTDGRKIFFFIFRLFGSRSVERPYLEVRNREITNSVLNLRDPFSSYGSKYCEFILNSSFVKIIL